MVTKHSVRFILTDMHMDNDVLTFLSDSNQRTANLNVRKSWTTVLLNIRNMDNILQNAIHNLRNMDYDNGNSYVTWTSGKMSTFVS